MVQFGEEISEEKVINNSKLETLYKNDSSKGNYFQVIYEDENGFEVQIAPRTMFKVFYVKEKNDINQFEISKFTKKGNNADFERKEKVTLSSFTFSKLISFLKLISEQDLKLITERRISLSDDELLDFDESTKKKVKTLLQKEEGKELVEELLKNGIITSKDLVNTGYRKEQLEIFRKLLYENYLEKYRIEESEKEKTEKTNNSKYKVKITENSKDETVWQYFFAKNQWIFGYGLDYRFNGIIQKESSLSSSNAGGKEEVKGDYLIGNHRYVHFVELKLPETPLFNKNQKNRSNSWKLSSDLFNAKSQILEQKASGLVKFYQKHNEETDEYKEIKGKAYDSKIILIIGNLKEQVEESEDEKGIKEIKKKTFELFRRDSRNIEILTYDELHERAKYIVKG